MQNALSAKTIERLKFLHDQLRLIARRPSMYLGNNSLTSVYCYYLGFIDGLRLDWAEEQKISIRRWLEVKNRISHPAWGFEKHLLYRAGSLAEAFKKFPDYHEEMIRDIQNGFDPSSLNDRSFYMSLEELHSIVWPDENIS